MPLQNLYPEKISDSIAAILKIWFDVITLSPIVQLRRNSACRYKMTCGVKATKAAILEFYFWFRFWLTIHRSKSKPKIEFQYGGRRRPPFSETGSSLSQSWIEISHRNFAWSRLPPSYTDAVTKPVPEVAFRLYGQHIKKSIWRHNSAADHPIIT